MRPAGSPLDRPPKYSVQRGCFFGALAGLLGGAAIGLVWGMFEWRKSAQGNQWYAGIEVLTAPIGCGGFGAIAAGVIVAVAFAAANRR